jgi:hypothetical protein
MRVLRAAPHLASQFRRNWVSVLSATLLIAAVCLLAIALDTTETDPGGVHWAVEGALMSSAPTAVPRGRPPGPRNRRRRAVPPAACTSARRRRSRWTGARDDERPQDPELVLWLPHHMNVALPPGARTPRHLRTHAAMRSLRASESPRSLRRRAE